MYLFNFFVNLQKSSVVGVHCFCPQQNALICQFLLMTVWKSVLRSCEETMRIKIRERFTQRDLGPKLVYTF